MTMLEQSLKAKYQANKNVFITCYLDVIDATAQGFKAQIGIRVPGDTVIPVGTKLFLSTPQTGAKEQEEIELFYVVVEGVEVEYGVPIQVCSPICRDVIKNRRKHPRKETYFEVEVDELESVKLTVVSGTQNGLTMLYSASKMLIGMALGNQYNLNAILKEEPFKVPVKVAHIHYDWHNYQHLIGVKVLKLNQNDEFMLNKLIDPSFKIGVRKSSIDIEEARIRPE